MVPFSTEIVTSFPVNSLLTPRGYEFVRLTSDNWYFNPLMLTPTLISSKAKTEQVFSG